MHILKSTFQIPKETMGENTQEAFGTGAWYLLLFQLRLKMLLYFHSEAASAHWLLFWPCRGWGGVG